MGAAQFESSAGALKRKMWLKNLKVIFFIMFYIFINLDYYH